MGKRGPVPAPSAIKKLKGTHRPDRQAANEIHPNPAVPDCPPWLDDEARAEWLRIVPSLAQLRILTANDRAMLANYCTAHSVAVNATIKYQKEGLMVPTYVGSLHQRKHPMLKVAQEARQQAMRLGQEFGLSPSSRTRISAPPPEKADDPDENFLFGPKLVNAS